MVLGRQRPGGRGSWGSFCPAKALGLPGQHRALVPLPGPQFLREGGEGLCGHPVGMPGLVLFEGPYCDCLTLTKMPMMFAFLGGLGASWPVQWPSLVLAPGQRQEG